MRVAIIMSALLGVVTNGWAADLDDSFIRGSSGYEPAVPVYYRWNGPYAGGQVGYASGQFDFSSATAPQTQLIINTTAFTNPITGKDDTSATAYGAFVGVNTQWDDAILGAELSYNHTNMLAVSSPGPFSITLGDGNTYRLNGSASANILDYATIRGRIGYAFSRFLPYAFAGAAIARADLTRMTIISPPIPPVNLPATVPAGASVVQNQRSFIYGYTFGAGMDIALMPNVFVRAEYEFIGLGEFMDSRGSLQTARVGAGVQF